MIGPGPASVASLDGAIEGGGARQQGWGGRLATPHWGRAVQVGGPPRLGEGEVGG